MLARLFFFIGVMLGALALEGCHGPVSALYPVEEGETGRVVYLASNHWHTGFVLKMEDLPEAYRERLGAFEAYEYVEVGWGSDVYYRAKEPTVWTGICAALFMPRGVMHVVGISEAPEERYARYLGELYRLRLSEAGYEALTKYVFEKTMSLDEEGRSQEVSEGLYGFSRFYRAHGYYCALHTCNHWATDGLREAGAPVTPMYAFTADNLCWQVRERCGKYQSDGVVLIK